jgi:beta-glucosidase
MTFPLDFLWGAATSSYQIEGGGLSEGRGECIWYRFSHTPGNVKNDDNGDLACDHLHRYRDDVALMAQLGLKAYRFSTAWARVLPNGTGAVNPAGLDFYDRLTDELLRHHLQPFLTLYHWDLPQALQDRGGWENPDSAHWFADYTDVMTRRLGDRVKTWITLNEPWCIAILSNLIGEHAPGKRDPVSAYRVAHHLHLAHGAAMQVIRRNAPGVPAGITLNLTPADPASDSDPDRQAAAYFDGWFNRWFLDPVFKGEYPDDMVELFTPILGGLDLDAVKAAAQPMDFLGINYYSRAVVRQNRDPNSPLPFESIRPDGSEYTAMNWEVSPASLTSLLVRVQHDYAPPVMYITENGSAYDDPPPVEGLVDDPPRRAYLEAHLRACHAAIEQGAKLGGYFAWSLLDNFEWAHGYEKRFGIIHVDFATQQRTLKRTAAYYRDVIARNALD